MSKPVFLNSVEIYHAVFLESRLVIQLATTQKHWSDDDKNLIFVESVNNVGTSDLDRLLLFEHR